MVQITKTARNFVKDRGGNIAAMFGLVLIPVTLVAGGTLDFAQSVALKSKMQNALDSAVLAVCSDSSKDPDTVIRDRLNVSLAEFGLNLLPAPAEGEEIGIPQGSEAIVLDTEFDQTTGTVTPKMTTNFPTYVMKLIGTHEIEINVSTQISCGAKKLELSLMLDVTGSMGSYVNGVRRIDSLKSAANDVFDIFERNMSEGSTRIALVPFASKVNVGSYATAVRGNQSSFRRTTGSWWRRRTRTYYPTNCVTERLGSQAFTDQAPGSGAYVGTYFSTNGNCSPNHEIKPLTSDASVLRSAVQNYNASGSTAGHLGSAWAWYMISDKWANVWPAGSKPEAPDPDRLIKATILMTDGEYNTQYCSSTNTGSCNNSPNGSSFSQAAQLCTNMKAEGVVVYAVGFGISENSYAAQQLKACATDDSKWFFPYDGTALREAFQSIGRSLAAGQAGNAIMTR